MLFEDLLRSSFPFSSCNFSVLKKYFFNILFKKSCLYDAEVVDIHHYKFFFKPIDIKSKSYCKL